MDVTYVVTLQAAPTLTVPASGVGPAQSTMGMGPVTITRAKSVTPQLSVPQMQPATAALDGNAPRQHM